LTKAILPPDSGLHQWTNSLSITELPFSYQVVTGLALVGGLLSRNFWVDQEKFKIYPNMNVLLVGPSGIGKDIASNQAIKVVREVIGKHTERIIEGKTIELVFGRMADLVPPAQAFILAPELTAFLGGKDYQKSMVQDLTNLLSSNDVLDVSIRSEQRLIQQPTVTMLAGTTAEWLQKAMPEGSMEGGFIPRFIIVNESYNDRMIPLIKHSLSKAEREAAAEQASMFTDLVKFVYEDFKQRPRECSLTYNAKQLYSEWYFTRFERFSPAIREYANRSRDQVLRIAMNSAVLRGHSFMDATDVRFAIAFIDYAAKGIEAALRPVPKATRLAEMIEACLPCNTKQLILRLRKSFTQEEILRGVELLAKSEVIRKNAEIWELCK
jgi:hypothetical protein